MDFPIVVHLPSRFGEDIGFRDYLLAGLSEECPFLYVQHERGLLELAYTLDGDRTALELRSPLKISMTPLQSIRMPVGTGFFENTTANELLEEPIACLLRRYLENESRGAPGAET